MMSDESETDAIFDALVAGIQQQSRRSNMLDSLGITISMRTLPSWPLRVFVSEIMYGTNWLSRLWCIHLRPRLHPKKQTQIMEAHERAKEITCAELINRIIKDGQ